VIEIVDLRVQSFDLDHLDITWSVADTAEDVSRYSLYLFKSIDGGEGPYRQIAGPFDNDDRFRDPDVSIVHKWRQHYYKIRVVSKDTGKEKEYGPVALAAQPDLIALEIQRRMNLVLIEYNGRRCLLFPALTSGQRCPVCFDTGTRGNTISRSKTQNCQTCYDTTFVGGYAKPILFFMQIDPGPTEPQLLDITERASVTTSSRTSAYPVLKPRDVIVDPENVRWQVEKVSMTQKRGAIVHQEPILHQIPKSDIRYSLPVPPTLLEDLKHREFTRPMCLERQ